MQIIKVTSTDIDKTNQAPRRRRWKSAFENIVPENQSGYVVAKSKNIKQLPRKKFIVLYGPSAGGEAPKDLIKVYEKEVVYENKERAAFHKTNKHRWTTYLAKAPYKWYPVESIIEYLLNRLGESIGMVMAGSKLVRVGERIFFLSRYFLNKNDQLVHGAQVYATYLSDEQFVQEVETLKLEHEIFTFQEAESAIKSMFHESGNQIFENLVKLLIFDAFIGNSDRHFYNWGAIKDVLGNKQTRFSPVYDTARGLFWNTSEQKIQEVTQDQREVEKFIRKYANNSKPKMGWNGQSNVNHFDFFRLICQEERRFEHLCVKIVNQQNLDTFLSVIDSEFTPLLSPERISLIKQCLQFRFEMLSCHIHSLK